MATFQVFALGQPHHDVPYTQCPGVGSRFDQSEYFVVVQPWNDRRQHHKHGYARLRERLHRAQPLPHRSGARLQKLVQFFFQRRNTDGHVYQPFGGQGSQQVKITQNKAVFGNEADRMPVLPKYFEVLAGQPEFPLGRLIRS